jgi:RNA polymerase sigma factor for flagellar operon FliA
MIFESFHSTDTSAPFITASSGDQAVAAPATEQELIENHLHLVHSAVARLKRTVPGHIDADDLRSIGLTGLVSAVRRFNPVQGRTFAGYAAMRIRGAMLDELRRLDSCSRRARARARQLKATTQELEQRHGREVTSEEVRNSLGLGREEYGKWVDEAQPVGFVAIDRSAEKEEGQGASLHDMLADEQDETGRVQLEKEELTRLLAQRIEELPSQQKKILALYYYENVRIGEIARTFGVTSSRVSQVHTRTLNELRDWLSAAREQ